MFLYLLYAHVLWAVLMIWFVNKVFKEEIATYRYLMNNKKDDSKDV